MPPPRRRSWEPIGSSCVSRGWVAGSSPPPSISAPPPTTTFPGGQYACAPLGESRFRKPEMASARSSSRNAAAGGALASCTLPPSAAIVTSAAAVRDAVLNVLMTLPTSCPSGAGAPVKTPRLDAFPHASSAWLRARAETTKPPTKQMMVRMFTSSNSEVFSSYAAPPSLPVAVTPTEPVCSAPSAALAAADDTGAPLRLSRMSPPGGARFSRPRVILVTWPTVTCQGGGRGSDRRRYGAGSAADHLLGVWALGERVRRRLRVVGGEVIDSF